MTSLTRGAYYMVRPEMVSPGERKGRVPMMKPLTVKGSDVDHAHVAQFLGLCEEPSTTQYGQEKDIARRWVATSAISRRTLK
jgi:hypothetical protein